MSEHDRSAPPSFDEIARQYWGAWGEALRQGAPGAAQAGTNPWQDAMAAWGRAAQGQRPDGGDAAARFDAQARQWFGRMQQVAAQFAGQPGSAADVVQAWRQAAESAGGSPFADLLRGMQGPGLHGFEPWFEQVRPLLDGMRGDALSWLRMPTFGFAREHQGRWQALALAVADYQQRMQDYQGLMAQATRDAYAIFERRLAERAVPGRELQSARALFDLWVDAAEDAYAKIALSPAFREVYGKLVDAQMRVRAGVQQEVEAACAQLGMPTRSELDGAHRKIVELERQLRRLRDVVEERGRGNAAQASSSSAGPADRSHGRSRKGGGKAAPAMEKVAKAEPVKKKGAKAAANPNATTTTAKGAR